MKNQLVIEADPFSSQRIYGFFYSSVAASERPGFIRFLDRMESSDVQIVTKLNRLGRNAMDVKKQLSNWPLPVYECIALHWAVFISAVLPGK